MTPANEHSTVLVVRIWTEYGCFPLRARLTWLDEQGMVQSLPVAGTAGLVASAVERVIQEAVPPA